MFLAPLLSSPTIAISAHGNLVFLFIFAIRAMSQLCNKQSPGSQESAVKLPLIGWQMRKSQGYISSRRADVLGVTQKWPVQRRPDAVSFNLGNLTQRVPKISYKHKRFSVYTIHPVNGNSRILKWRYCTI